MASDSANFDGLSPEEIRVLRHRTSSSTGAVDLVVNPARGIGVTREGTDVACKVFELR